MPDQGLRNKSLHGGLLEITLHSLLLQLETSAGVFFYIYRMILKVDCFEMISKAKQVTNKKIISKFINSLLLDI